MVNNRPPRQATGRQIGTLLLALILAISGGGVLVAGLILPLAMTAGTAANAITGVFEDVPDDLGFTEPSEQSVLLAADGSVIARFYAENRIVVSSDQISQPMKDAAVAIEDRRFYEHHGIDVQGTLGALFSNIVSGGTSGGSSITQQYVKNSLVEQGRTLGDDDLVKTATEQTLSRKINEARYAIAVEKTMTKDEILTGYLNLVQFGPSQYGVETAAQYYFSKSAKDLSYLEAATLAGITQNPAKWDPVKHPDNSFERRNVVLTTMLRDGYITQEEYDAGVNVPVEDTLHVSRQVAGCGAAGNSAYFCEYVVKDLLQDESWGKDAADRTRQLYRGGLVIRTSLDPKKQEIAFNTVTKHQPVDDPSGIEASLTSIEPGTGHIVAMVQNTRWGTPNETDDRMTQVNVNVGKTMGGGSGFQTGSTFKIFTLVEWIRAGHSGKDVVSLNADTTFPAGTFKASCSPRSAMTSWRVSNLGWPGGANTVEYAIKNSINGGAAHMAMQLDLCDIINDAEKMGVRLGNPDAEWNYGPSLVLGANEATPLSMAVAVSTLANDGTRCDPMSYTTIEDQDGNVISKRSPKCEQVLEPDVARQVTKVLQGVVTPGATGDKARLADGRPVAGKTGTANNDWHAWFVGYTPQLATAVWQGHIEGNISMLNSTINGRFYREVYGGLFPAMIFSEYTSQSLEGVPPASFPAPSQPNIPTRPHYEAPAEEEHEEATEEPAVEEPDNAAPEPAEDPENMENNGNGAEGTEVESN
ncbi:transglycosylase domain-containing protein [Actinobaculum suis]|uniref:Transglycosylase domain-containing protein n=1 Tax=Actinobaculum suis TaxID=1657 RepID=A0AAW9HEW1_9ACTO|nr:transglycosylase domain-containing protein [Actinobaculum suis]MDY5152481.1 transglycosylase domain-containing protein [Actinobaculum suis]